MGFGRRGCWKNATIERDGKWYCRQHDPEEVKRRREEYNRAWDEKYRAEKDAREAKVARARLVRQRSRQAIEALRRIVMNRIVIGDDEWSLLASIDAERILDDLEN